MIHGLFSTSKLCSAPTVKPAVVVEEEPVSNHEDDEQMMDLAKELEISDESCDEQEEYSEAKENNFDTNDVMDVMEAMDVIEDTKTNEVVEWALRDAEIVNKRLKIHVDALSRSQETFDPEKFKNNPNNFASWLSNIETFLKSASLIADRCQHLQDFIALSED